MKIINWLKGKKTYLIGAGLIAMGIYNCATGDVDQGAQQIGEGFAVMTLRAGIAKK